MRDAGTKINLALWWIVLDLKQNWHSERMAQGL